MTVKEIKALPTVRESKRLWDDYDYLCSAWDILDDHTAKELSEQDPEYFLKGTKELWVGMLGGEPVVKFWFE